MKDNDIIIDDFLKDLRELAESIQSTQPTPPET